MGLPGFYYWLKNKRYKGVLRRQMPGNVASLLLDMNSILHEVAHKVYAY